MRLLLGLLLALFVGEAHAQRWAPFQATTGSGGGSSSCQTLGGASCDANGFTILAAPTAVCEGNAGTCASPPTTTTRIIYVCPATGNVGCVAGNDNALGTNLCGTFAAPCATPNIAANYLQDGHPDWILLACGNTFAVGFNTIAKSGLSPTQPMVFSSYDPTQAHPSTTQPPVGGPDSASCSSRPLVRQAASVSTLPPFGNGINNVAYIGIKFYAYTRDPTNVNFALGDAQTVLAGPSWFGANFTGILIENCWIGSYLGGPDMETNVPYQRPQNVFIRRNQIIANYPSGPFNQNGILTGGFINSAFYENVFDHNAWNTGTATNPISWANPSGFTHNLYIAGQGNNGNIQWGNTPVITGNIFANEGGAPAIRSGSFAVNNFFVNNAGGWQSINQPLAVTNTFTSNVVSQGTTFGGPTAVGYSVNDRYINENMTLGGSTATGNIVTASPGNPSASGYAFGIHRGTNGNTLTGNILYNWSFGAPGNAFSNGSCDSNVGLAAGCPIYSSTGYYSVTSGGTGYVDHSLSIVGAQSSNTALTYGTTGITAASDGQDYVVLQISGTNNQTQGLAIYGQVYTTAGGLSGNYSGSIQGSGANLFYGGINTLGTFTASNCSTSPVGCAVGTYTCPLINSANQTPPLSAQINLTVSGAPAKVTAINSITNSGARYLLGDQLSVAPTCIGGASGGSTNFTVPIATFLPGYVILYGSNCTAITCTSLVSGSLYYPWYNVPLTAITGTGSGAQVDIISASGSIVAAWTLGSDSDWFGETTNPGGGGYKANDTLNATPGASASVGPTYTIASGTYTSGTGVIVLTLVNPVSFGTGVSVSLSGMLGTGNVGSLNRNAGGGPFNSIATTSGTTLTLQGPTGLSMTITGGAAAVAEFSFNGTTTAGSGMVLTVPSGTSGLAINTIGATGCNFAGGQNAIDAAGANTCSYSDPNRTAGSYVADNAVAFGVSANTTFTGATSGAGCGTSGSCVLTASVATGVLGLGDAVTWSGQSKHDYIKGDGSSRSAATCGGSACTGNNGSCTTNCTFLMTGINAVQSSILMSDWTASQFLALADNQSKQTWNQNLRACKVNDYIRGGFGMTATGCPTQ